MATGGLNPPQFSGDEVSYEQFTKDLEIYFTASGIDKAASVDRCQAMFLHLGGLKIKEIFELRKTTVDKNDGEDNYAYTKRLVDERLKPSVNLTFESFNFRKTVQRDGESFDDFVHRVTIAAGRCAFDDKDRQTKDQIVIGCSSDNLRKVALREDPDLAKVLSLGRSEESAVLRCSTMKSSTLEVDTDVNAIRSDQSGSTRTCYSCGEPHPHHNPNECKGIGNKCSKCGKFNHLPNVCWSTNRSPRFSSNRSRGGNRGQRYARNVSSEDYEGFTDPRNVHEDRSYDESPDANRQHLANNFCVTSVNNVNKNTSETVDILIDKQVVVKFIPDTGASVSIIDFDTYNRLCQSKHYPLSQSSKILKGYNSDRPLEILGSVNLVAERIDCKSVDDPNDKRVVLEMFVLKDKRCGNLLSRDACERLKLIKLLYNINTNTNTNIIPGNEATPKDLPTAILKVLDSFPSGIGMLKDVTLKLKIDKDYQPVIQKTRKVPIALRKPVENLIKDLLEKGIIEEVPKDEATTWLSPVHVVQTREKIRLVVDMRIPNKAIQRVRRPIPTPEEVLQDLTGAKFFSKIDLNSAYHQIRLDPESRDITTFTTHCGNFRYTTLMFGVNSACEDFQYTMSKELEDLSGVKNISDDIIVYGKDEEEHDRNLYGLLKRLQERGMTINRDKCSFKTQKVQFFGQEISPSGIKPIIKESLTQIQRPNTKSEVRSYMGTVTYISKFIPNFSTIVAPISDLISKDREFKWEAAQEEAFQLILEEIRSPRVLAHFDPKKETSIITDASPVGLSAILSQEERPVTFISRKLTPVEQRYAQTEREALAVVWGVERLHFYLYGIQFQVKSDHSSLLTLYSPKGTPGARVLRWALRLLPYRFEIKHIPGVTNPADYFSRKPVSDYTDDDENAKTETETFVNNILAYSSPNAISIQEICTESESCQEIQQVIKYIKDQWRNCHKDFQTYFKIKDELTYKSGLTNCNFVIRGDRLILPVSLRKRAIKLAHESHSGITKTKELIRTKVWWPGMDREVEEYVKACHICQAVTPNGKERLEPLIIKPIPQRPFSTVHIDLFGPLESGKTLLGIVDELSRWPEVYILPGTKTKDVIDALDDTFGRFGNPDKVTSDNGPQFRSWEFKNFLEKNGIIQHLTTPYYPQGNSTVERFFRNLKKFVKACDLERKVLSKELHKFLNTFRNTPTRGTGMTPASLILNYSPKGNIASYNDFKSNSSPRLQQAEAHERDYKNKMKAYADKELKLIPSNLKEGDFVLIQHTRRPTKSQSVFDPDPWRVDRRSGNQVHLSRGAKRFIRPLSHCKKVNYSSRNTSSYHEERERYDYDIQLPAAPVIPARQPAAARNTPAQRPQSPRPLAQMNYPAQSPRQLDNPTQHNRGRTLDRQGFRERVMTPNREPTPAQRYTLSGRPFRGKYQE